MSTSRSSARRLALALALSSPLVAVAFGQGPAITVSVLPVTRAALYSSVAPETFLFFTDAPIRFEVAISAAGGAELKLKNPDSFARGMRRRLSHMQGNVRGERPADFVLEGDSEAPAGRGRLSKVLGMRASGPRLPTGSYRLNVEFDVAELVLSEAKPTMILGREIRFEVRAPSSLGEDLDNFLHQAYLSKLAGDLPRSRAWAEEALKIHSRSLPAMADIAEAWRAEGKCGMAAQYWKRAIETLMTNGDALLISPIQQSAELRGDWAARMTRCPR